MIKRRYFYHIELQDRNPRFMNGIVESTSFTPDPKKVWLDLLDELCKRHGYERSQLVTKAFYRV